MTLKRVSALLTYFLTFTVLAQPVAVRVETVGLSSMEERVETVGQVESLQSPTVSAEVTAKVMQVLVEIGDPVQPGTKLAALDGEAYALKLAEAKSEVQRLDAMVKRQSTQVKRYRRLLKTKGIDRATYDKAVAENKSFIAQREYARARVKSAELTLKQTQIVSPIEGVVDERMISVGDYVVPGNPLFRLVGNKKLRVRLPFSERLYPQIQKDQKVYLTSAVRPQHPIEARVDYLRPQIERESRAIEVFAVFDNTQNWLPGASVNAALLIDRHANALTIPLRAVVERPAGQVVYLIKPVKGTQKTFKVEERIVTTGVVASQGVQVLSGLSGGERLAVDGARFLTEGAEVDIVP